MRSVVGAGGRTPPGYPIGQWSRFTSQVVATFFYALCRPGELPASFLPSCVRTCAEWHSRDRMPRWPALVTTNSDSLMKMVSEVPSSRVIETQSLCSSSDEMLPPHASSRDSSSHISDFIKIQITVDWDNKRVWTYGEDGIEVIR